MTTSSIDIQGDAISLTTQDLVISSSTFYVDSTYTDGDGDEVGAIRLGADVSDITFSQGEGIYMDGNGNFRIG